MSADVDAFGIPDQCRSDRIVGEERTACADAEDVDRLRPHGVLHVTVRIVVLAN